MILPLALTCPPVRILPAVALPVELKVAVEIALHAVILPLVILPFPDKVPLAKFTLPLKVGPVMLPPALICPLVVILPPVIFAVALTRPPVKTLPPVTLPVAVMTPLVRILPNALMLP